MDICTSISRMTAYENNTYYKPNELFTYLHIKLDKGATEKLYDVNIIYLKDLRINEVRYKKITFVFIDVFANCVFTKDHFREFYFFKMSIKACVHYFLSNFYLSF